MNSTPNHSGSESDETADIRARPDASPTIGPGDNSHDTLSEMARLRSQLVDAHERIADLESRLAAAAQAAGGSGAAKRPSDASDQSLLLDDESKLFSEAYFNVALDARLAAAKRHLRPVAVALLDVSEGPGTSRAPAPATRGADAIRQTLRDADTACRLGDGTFALILEDTPENGAVWTVERIRRNLVSRFGTHTMWAGVACYPAHAFSAEELLSQCREALNSAKDWNQDRIEVAIAE